MNQYLALVLTEASRAALLQARPPKHERVIAHHMTIEFVPTAIGLKLVGQQHKILVYAYAADSMVDCVAVGFDGTTIRRDKSFYHVTLSVSPDGKPVMSNNLIRRCMLHGLSNDVTFEPQQTVLHVEGTVRLVDHG